MSKLKIGKIIYRNKILLLHNFLDANIPLIYIVLFVEKIEQFINHSSILVFLFLKNNLLQS
jgi:hypothetical protein